MVWSKLEYALAIPTHVQRLPIIGVDLPATDRMVERA